MTELNKLFQMAFLRGAEKKAYAPVTLETSFYDAEGTTNNISVDIYIQNSGSFLFHFDNEVVGNDVFDIKSNALLPDIKIDDHTGLIYVETESTETAHTYTQTNFSEINTRISNLDIIKRLPPKSESREEVDKFFDRIITLMHQMQEFATNRLKVSGDDIRNGIAMDRYKVYNIQHAYPNCMATIIIKEVPLTETKKHWIIEVRSIESSRFYKNAYINSFNSESFMIKDDQLYIFDKEESVYRPINRGILWDDVITTDFPKYLDAELRYAIYEIWFNL